MFCLHRHCCLCRCQLATVAFVLDNNFVSTGISIGQEGGSSNPFKGFNVVGVIAAATVFLPPRCSRPSSCPLLFCRTSSSRSSPQFLLGGGGIVRFPFTFTLPWLVVASHLVAPPPPLPLVFTTHCVLLLSSCSATSASHCLEAPLAFETMSPLVCWCHPSNLPLIPRLVVATHPSWPLAKPAGFRGAAASCLLTPLLLFCLSFAPTGCRL